MEAPSTSSKHPPGPSGQTSTESITIKLVGAAQKEHGSFIDLATSSLDIHCRGWKDSENPRSHMIPPIFVFKNREKPDQEIDAIRPKLEEIKKTAPSKFDSEHRLVIDRDSDEAEHMVFDALFSLSQEQSLAPFFAIRGLDFNKNRSHLDNIFPNVARPQCFHECDFVIIGPHVGIVVIEVKGSAFTQAKHFPTPKVPEDIRDGLNQTELPKDIRKGFDQLRSFDSSVLAFLNQFTDECVPSSQIRRILVTPNLKKSRFDAWFASDDHRIKPSDVDLLNRSQDDDVQWWFKDDMTNDQSVNADGFFRKPPLYDKLRKYLFETDDIHRLSQNIYELFAPILTGIASVVVKVEGKRKCIELDEVKVSQPMAVKEESHLLETGDFMSILRIFLSVCAFFAQFITKRRKAAKEIKTDRQQQWLADRKEVTLRNAMILSPEQLNALNGPSHQVIIGGAGCGKTIILEAKALELLHRGESVLVICADSCVKRFKLLFRNHGFDRGSVISWEGKYGSGYKIPGGPQEWQESIGIPATTVYGIADTPEKRFRELINAHKHILIDDALDDDIIQDAMRYCRYVWTTSSNLQTIWIAMDPILQRINVICHGGDIKELFRIPSSFDIRVVQLTQVMRYPECVYEHVISSLLRRTDKVPRPVISHKIRGLRCPKKVGSFDQLCKEINQTLNDYRGKFRVDQIAIILGGTENFCKQLRKVRPNVFVTEFQKEAMVFDSNAVASLEWPLVIYVEGGRVMGDLPNQISYRSYTRTTGILFHFICNFEVEEEPQPSEEGIATVVFELIRLLYVSHVRRDHSSRRYSL